MPRTSSSGNDEALVDEDQRSPLLNSHPEALAQILDLHQPLDLDCCLLDPLPLLRRGGADADLTLPALHPAGLPLLLKLDLGFEAWWLQP